jgi:hypothetical protein
MDIRGKMLVVITSLTIVSLAVTCVTANGWISNTPLYILRMEQQSSKMHFLPTATNNFTYTAEKGVSLNYSISGCCGGIPLVFTQRSTECDETCGNSCGITCDSCGNTCGSTCPSTCGSTCPYTCWSTCAYSCGGTCATCGSTCDETCGGTCDETCDATCHETCDTCQV